MRASAGDPERLLFGRSSEKPLQGAVSLAAMDPRDLTDDEVAVMCASHDGEPAQVAAVRRLLRRGPVSVSALRNPRDRATKGRRPPVWDQCSGNHAGLLVASSHRGWDLETYRRPGHPIQRRVTKAVVAATDVDRPRIGVDGCGIPVHGLPLRAMATLFARLGSREGLDDDLSATADRVVRAMLASPGMVAGTKRLDTDVMRATGTVVVKGGAEGLVCAAIVPMGLGLAVKASDGNGRRLSPAVISVLRELGALDGVRDGALDRHERLPVLGGDQVQGAVEAVIRLDGARRR